MLAGSQVIRARGARVEGCTLLQDFSEASLAAAARIGPTLSYSGGDNGTYFDSAGVLRTSDADAARLSYTFDGTKRIARRLLIEEARTNLILQSEGFLAPWMKFGALSIAINNDPAPDGTMTADRIVDISTGAFQAFQQDISISTAVAPWTWSVYCNKQAFDTFPEFQFIMSGGVGKTGAAQLDLLTGATAIRVDPGDLTIAVEELKDHWRYSMTMTNTGGNNSVQVGILPAASSTTLGALNTSALGGVGVWGHQVEQGAFATSYISTTTASVKRAADVVTMSDVSWFNQSMGTFLINLVPYNATPPSNEIIMQIDSGSGSNRILFENSSVGADRLKYISVNTIGNNASIVFDNVFTDNTRAVVIGTYAQDDVIMAVDGTLSSSDTSADFPISVDLTTLRIGSNHDGEVQFNGHIAKVSYWQYRVPDAMLQAFTA